MTFYRARKLNSAERDNSYSAYELNDLAVCETVIMQGKF
jgi:hypothetical protein